MGILAPTAQLSVYIVLLQADSIKRRLIKSSVLVGFKGGDTLKVSPPLKHTKRFTRFLKSSKSITTLFSASLRLCVLTLLLISCQNDPKKTTSTPNIPTTGNPAIDGLTKEIALQPNDPRLYAQRGALYYENEGYDEAIQDLNKALSYNSTNVTYMHLLADAYLDYYQSYNAISTMKKAAT